MTEAQRTTIARYLFLKASRYVVIINRNKQKSNIQTWSSVMSAAKKVQIVSSLCKLSLLLLLSLLLSNFIPITKGIQIHNYSRRWAFFIYQFYITVLALTKPDGINRNTVWGSCTWYYRDCSFLSQMNWFGIRKRR